MAVKSERVSDWHAVSAVPVGRDCFVQQEGSRVSQKRRFALNLDSPLTEL